MLIVIIASVGVLRDYSNFKWIADNASGLRVLACYNRLRMTAAADILEGLNPPQREAVETMEGPLLIVAGPGSGKTRVITHRIAYLTRVCGISPYRILAVTFTNKAAREMRDRLQRLVGTRADNLTVGTFHAFCVGLLRREGKHIGLDPKFSIFDDEDQMVLVKEAMEQAELDPKRYPPRAIHGVISKAKSLLMDSEALAQNQQSHFEDQAAKVYRWYEDLMGRNNGVDFDDLLLRAVQLLRGNPEVLKRYQQRYLHVLVDEFQDTNIAQYALARLLAGEYRNICVVGDADQSIYSWRHADIRNILSFQKDYPEARTINLAESYRSTSTILEAAKSLISTNQMRLAKDLWTRSEKGQRLVVHEGYDQEEEAQFVLSEVARLGREQTFKPGDCAVMYRVNAQSRAMEEACLRYGMKYKLVGGVRFYQRREVKDVISYLRVINNPSDEISLTRVINVPLRGIGDRTVEELTQWARNQDISLFTAMERVAQASGQSSAQSSEAAVPGEVLSPRAARTIAGFAKLISGLVEDSQRLDVVELIDAVLERTGYRDYLFDRDEKAEERWENIRELRNTAQEFRLIEPPDGLADLLERLALVADVDSYEETADSLTLITLHQAKGLEFPVVFIVGMEEGLLPHIRSMDNAEELEEERRLCYVGMTRSKERLYLLRAFRRGFTGSMVGPSSPSRFLKEIPEHLIASAKPATVKPAAWNTWAPAAPSTEPVPAPPSFKSGDKVRHGTFGQGMVVSCVASGLDHELTVAFAEPAGVKRLLLSFARLEKLE